MLANVIFMGLASAYLTYLVSQSYLFSELRKRVGNPTVLTCPPCFSFWSACLVCLFTIRSYTLLEVLAVATISTVINLWIKEQTKIKVSVRND